MTVVLTIVSVSIILSYQNCAAPRSVTSTSTDKPDGSQPPEKVMLSNDFNLVDFYVRPFLEETHLTVDANDYEAIARLDPTLKKLWVFSANEVQQIFCLDNEDVQAIRTIITQTEYCKYPELSDRVCTMVYKFPHTVVYYDTENLRLGEKSNGCASYIDACDLPNYQAQIVQWTNSISQKVCEQ